MVARRAHRAQLAQLDLPEPRPPPDVDLEARRRSRTRPQARTAAGGERRGRRGVRGVQAVARLADPDELLHVEAEAAAQHASERLGEPDGDLDLGGLESGVLVSERVRDGGTVGVRDVPG